MSELINSNVCQIKCDVHKQNAEMDNWIADNPDKITYLADGISTNKRNKFRNIDERQAVEQAQKQ